MKIIIVDKNDQPIGLKPRNQLTPKDIYRVSALWLTNQKGEILIALRSFSKAHDPGKWGPAVAGTIEEGQDYEINIVQETLEELGVTGLNIKPFKKLFNDSKKPHFTQWFEAITTLDIPDFKLQVEEVEAVRWISQGELRSDLKLHPEKYLHNMPRILEMFSDRHPEQSEGSGL